MGGGGGRAERFWLIFKRNCNGMYNEVSSFKGSRGENGDGQKDRDRDRGVTVSDDTAKLT